MVDYLDDDDDDDCLKSLYENGHWEWNEIKGCIRFVSNAPLTVKSEASHQVPVVIGPIQFKDDLDILEQQRFRKRFQRITVEDDVVTLQDIKDYVLFTAPKTIVTPALVKVLHLPATERFLRALIIYCQYFLQVSDEMKKRIFELQFKIRTHISDEVEIVYRDNLEDLRILIAKEYCSIIAGFGDFAKYHHMGASKKSPSLTKRDRILFETIVRISTQIVWLALGRKSYNQIELEVHRLFKSDVYNVIQHKLESDHRSELDERELFVLGHAGRQARKLTAHSPLMDRVHCPGVDYRIMGLGIIQYKSLSPRLRFFERVLTAPEAILTDSHVSMGIVGLPRARFDTTLKEVKVPITPGTHSTSSGAIRKNTPRNISVSKQSKSSTSSRKSTQLLPLFEDIIIPDKEDITDSLPDQFPDSELQTKSRKHTQRRKWLVYSSHFHKLHKTRAKSNK